MIHYFGKDSDDTIFDQLKSNLIIISMNIQNAVNLLCTAHSKNLIWPKYAWIIIGHSVDDFESHAATVNKRSSCNADKLTEGIVFIQQHLTVQDHDLKLISGLTYNDLSRLLQHHSLAPKVNPYAYVLHDAIWTVALALNESNDTDISATLNDIDFTGASGPVKFVNNKREGLSVEILQVRDVVTNLGIYIDGNLTIVNHIEDFTLIDNAQTSAYQKKAIIYVGITSCSVIMTTIFITLVLIFYLHFRHEEAIKATSIVLSMMVFLSCYLVLLYLLLLNLTLLPQYQHFPIEFKTFTCVIYIWLNGLGVPTNLILATLIVKMVRVYRIFSVANIKNKYQSNSILFLEIFVIMIPNLVILILWSTIDTCSIERVNYFQDSVTGETTATDSDHLLIWLALLTLYLIILMVSLVAVAVKTRKIQYKNFKDTKKVNALVLLLILTFVLTSYWFIIRTIRYDHILGHAVLHIGHILIIYEMMGFLFVPKIYPLIKEKWFTKINTVHAGCKD